MLKAIQEYKVKGIETTLPFGAFVCQHEAFTSGNFDTHFVKKYYSPEALQQQTETEAHLAALVAVKQYLEDQKQLRVPTN